MKEVPLTQGKVALVDDADYECLSQFKWYAHWDRWNFYAVRKESLTHRDIYMHKEIQPGRLVDHANGNTLDNQRVNLRACTPTQNSRNVRVRSGKSSQYKGVCLDKKRGGWIARIRVDKISIFLGRFDSELDAARAYDRKALEAFGEFGRTNFPPPQDASA